MDLIEALARHAEATPHRVVHAWRGQQLTFGDLARRSDDLALRLVAEEVEAGRPIVVYGHKQPEMLVGFLGCVKAGHPYIPVDSSTPGARVQAIIEASRASHLVAVEAAEVKSVKILPVDGPSPSGQGKPQPVAKDDPFYVIYTSGSTGTPKGVQISRRSISNFVGWPLGLLPPMPADGHVFLNQAPFSFDLSVYELSMGLASGGRIHSVDRDHIARLPELFDDLAGSGVTVWISTPSFADLCLASAAFSKDLLPELRTFLFCGETLSRETVEELNRRFPQAKVFNTYGPTESTVAVTAVECDREVLARHEVLPVGVAREGTVIHILDPEGNPVPEGEMGEIVIVGDTVSLGYLGEPELTAQKFTVIDGQPAYRTGDAGRMDGGMLHFGGRLDFQVKLHGYRIEIEDIEANLRRLPGVLHAAVLPVSKNDGPISHLHTFIQVAELPASPLRHTLGLRTSLKEYLPDYMIPKTFSYLEAMPLTANGKVDRAVLRDQL
ncbi:D-alanine--poly(phosphoribitol) ligase subunit DltA [Arachnia propionica]|nr:D-alanine--poly(phosphoribitol) ligase subunit DltA [Arachnia propionica]